MKIAVVTGASSGMGREFVLQLAKKEKLDEIWVIARRIDRLSRLAEETDVKIRPLPLDLTLKTAFDSYQKLLEEEKPHVSVLVNCSGYGKFGSFEDIPVEESLGMIDLNCKALVSMTEGTLPYMKEGSKIIQLDSLSAFQPVPYLNVYAATKAFVLSYSRALNRELKSRRIKVLAVCPGWVKTEFFDRAFATSEKAVTYFNHVYTPEAVVKTAIKHAYHTKKDVSVHGFPIKFQVLLVKMLPHRLVMKIWTKQQKH